MKSEPGRDRISAAQLAAAEAIFDAWYNASHPMMRVPERIEEWREEASKLAVVAVAAIAAKGWGEAEAATRVLRDFAAEEGLGGTKKCVGGWNTGYICGFDDEGEPIRGFTDYCRYCAARALVGSEKGNEDG